MLLKDNGQGDFEEPQAGTVIATSYKLIDLGTVTDEWQGVKRVRRRGMMGWELVEPMADGRPFTVNYFYTLSLSEKSTLRKHLESWRGKAFTEEELKGFDVKAVLGKPCMLSLIENKKKKIEVSSVIKMPAGMQAPVLVNPIQYFSLDDFKQEAFDALSDNMKRLVMQSPEYAYAVKALAEQKAIQAAAPKGTFNQLVNNDEDIPF